MRVVQQHMMLRFIERLLEAGDEEQQKRRDAHRDQREIPVEPEHEADDADDRQHVDEDVQRRR